MSRYLWFKVDTIIAVAFRSLCISIASLTGPLSLRPLPGFKSPKIKQKKPETKLFIQLTKQNKSHSFIVSC